MSDMLGKLGGFFSGESGQGLTKLGELGLTGAGLFGNISAERQRAKELDYLKKQQAGIPDPTKLAQEVAAATQPLNRGLVESVGNQVSGTLAEQGLAQAPGIQGTVLAQALAPFQQQNQATALQLVMKQLGLPLEYAQTLLAGLPGQTNLAPLLALLQNKPAATGGGGGADALMRLLTGPSTPAQSDWTASLPGTSDATPPDTSSWQIPDWLTSGSATAPAFGG